MGKRTGKNRKTDGRAGYGKRVAAVGMMFVMLFSFAACGKTTASEEAEALSGSCIDILNKVYETADLDASMRDAMQDYEMTTIDADMEEYVLGTDEITYTDSAYSAPMMTSVAYQCVVLRVPKSSTGTGIVNTHQIHFLNIEFFHIQISLSLSLFGAVLFRSCPVHSFSF